MKNSLVLGGLFISFIIFLIALPIIGIIILARLGYTKLKSVH